MSADPVFPDFDEFIKQLRGVNYEMRDSGLLHVGHDGYVRDDLVCACVIAAKDLRGVEISYKIASIG